MRLLASIALILLLPLSLGCGRDRADETGGLDTTTNMTAAPEPALPDTAAAPADFGFEQRRDFASSIRTQLSDFDRQISDLASQAKSRGGAVSDRALANIRTARRSVDQRLGRVEAATAGNWEQVKEGVNRAVESLSESIGAAQPK